ncbi:MAG TPA: hypothetical protein VFH51_17540, partial [Myxococcota bacterium]|nr:hypothetical protein [Myxococcota bacterium]
MPLQSPSRNPVATLPQTVSSDPGSLRATWNGSITDGDIYQLTGMEVNRSQLAPGGKGAHFVTMNDEAVGKLDKRIQELSAYDASTEAGKSVAEELARARAARRYLNIIRWQSTAKSGNEGAGFKSLISAVSAGKLSWDELGDIDITALDRDPELANSVQELLNKKAAAEAPAAAPASDPATAQPDPTGAAASALYGDFSSAWDYASSMSGDKSVQTFDQQQAGANAGISGLAQGF